MDESRAPALNCENCNCRVCHPGTGTDIAPCPCARDFSIDTDAPADALEQVVEAQTVPGDTP